MCHLGQAAVAAALLWWRTRAGASELGREGFFKGFTVAFRRLQRFFGEKHVVFKGFGYFFFEALKVFRWCFVNKTTNHVLDLAKKTLYKLLKKKKTR